MFVTAQSWSVILSSFLLFLSCVRFSISLSFFQVQKERLLFTKYTIKVLVRLAMKPCISICDAASLSVYKTFFFFTKRSGIKIADHLPVVFQGLTNLTFMEFYF